MAGGNGLLKILMTADTVGGVWTYCMELCKALQYASAQIFLVTSGARMKKAQREEVAALSHVTVYETDYKLEWMENPWADIETSGQYLLELEAALQPDVIHLNSYTYGSLPWKAPVVMVAHSDVFSWWQAVKKEQPPAEWRTYFNCVKEGINSSDRLIAPSQTMLNYIQNIYAPEVEQQVIFNARSRELFAPGDKQQFIFCMGRLWDEAKNIQLLIKAAPHIQYLIKIAGDHQFENNQQAVQAGKIQYLGTLNSRQVAAQLASAAIYTLPARYEPFGLSILEAALSGCALVLGNIDSLKELWENKAVYVDTHEPLALADLLNYLMKNKAIRMQYARKAYVHAQKFSTQHMAQQYLQVYQQLIQLKTTNLKTAIA